MEKGVIKVLIADDHGIFRTGLKVLLSQFKHVQVVGEARDGQELLRRSAELCPDVILTDAVMPVMDGIAATRELSRRKASCRVVVMSAHSLDDPLIQTLEAGALGYVLKSADSSEISEAISYAYHHKSYFCSETSARLTDLLSRKPGSATKPTIAFTDREKEIIRLICNEATSKEIAHKLSLSKRTIEGHRTRIMDKLGVKSIAGVITYAVEKKLN